MSNYNTLNKRRARKYGFYRSEMLRHILFPFARIRLTTNWSKTLGATTRKSIKFYYVIFVHICYIHFVFCDSFGGNIFIIRILLYLSYPYLDLSDTMIRHQKFLQIELIGRKQKYISHRIPVKRFFGKITTAFFCKRRIAYWENG